MLPKLLLLAVLALPSGAVALSACRGSNSAGSLAPDETPSARGEKGAVERTVRDAVDAYNLQDISSFLAYWTDKGLQEEFGLARQQILGSPSVLFGGPPRTLRSLSRTGVSGGTATTQAEFAIGLGLSKEKLSLINEGGSWKLDGSQAMPVDIPNGATIVPLVLREFAFDYDKSKLSGGKVAFEVRNLGSQPHELVLLRTPDGFNLTQALQSPTAPAGVDVLAGFGPLEPGEQGTLVLSDMLPAGHYTMVCLLPDSTDPRGTAHALKGMVSDFYVVPQGGGR